VTRSENILRVTKRLILMTSAALVLVVGAFGLTYLLHLKFPVSWVCFGCGLVGGFISIQQRLKRMGNEELNLLSQSWFQIILVPIYGGVFALILYVALIGQIISGAMFPEFYVPAFHQPPVPADIEAFLGQTSPKTGVDVAKLFFWALVAGFSERLIPQILSKDGGDTAGKGDKDGKPGA